MLYVPTKLSSHRKKQTPGRLPLAERLIQQDPAVRKGIETVRGETSDTSGFLPDQGNDMHMNMDMDTSGGDSMVNASEMGGEGVFAVPQGVFCANLVDTLLPDQGSGMNMNMDIDTSDEDNMINVDQSVAEQGQEGVFAVPEGVSCVRVNQ